MQTELLDLENRRKIYNFLLNNPGIHQRQICRNLNIPKATTNYHIRYLQKRGLITQNSENHYTRYYVAKKIGINKKKILSIIRQETPRNIIILFLTFISLSRAEISKELEEQPNTISYYLKKLKELDVIETAKTTDEGILIEWRKPRIQKRNHKKNEVIYQLKNADEIYDTLILYGHSLGDNEVIKSAIHFLQLGHTWDIPKKINNSTSFVNSLEETISEMFPPPIIA